MRLRPRMSFVAASVALVISCKDATKDADGGTALTLSGSAMPSSAATPASANLDGGTGDPKDAASVASASAPPFGVSVDADAACRDYASGLCQREEACSPSLLALRHGDLPTCVRVETKSCEATLALGGSGATPDAIARCKTARTASCAALVGDPPVECRSPGTIADGAPCVQNAQCVGEFCDRNPTRHCGTCRHLAELHQQCGQGLVCGWGLVCNESQCQKRGGKGDACRGGMACNTPLVCVKGQCAEPLEAGARCDPSDKSLPDCDASSALVCSPAKKTCVATVVAKLGESCAKNLCTSGTYCGAKKTCERNARDADPCGPTGPFCEAPSLCIGGVCTLLDPRECK